MTQPEVTDGRIDSDAHIFDAPTLTISAQSPTDLKTAFISAATSVLTEVAGDIPGLASAIGELFPQQFNIQTFEFVVDFDSNEFELSIVLGSARRRLASQDPKLT